MMAKLYRYGIFFFFSAMVLFFVFTSTPVFAENLPVMVPDEAKACVQCHIEKKTSMSAIRDWSVSKHALEGIGCHECHIPDEQAPEEIKSMPTRCEDKRVRRSVSPKNCAQCHEDQVKQFETGKHSKAWIAMLAMPTTLEQPSPIIFGEKGCGGCHRIGRDEGKCDSCHTRHRFSAAEARRPEACMTCHMGFDHPQWEMWSTSKHGSIYRIEGAQWDWNRPLSQWFEKPFDPKTPRAPVCSTCHMPGGDHAVKTAWGFLALRLAEKDPEWAELRNKIMYGLGVINEKGELTERVKVVQAGEVVRMTAEEWQEQRNRVLQVCQNCHTPGYAQQQLDLADQIIKEADKLMAEAIEIVDGLYRDGILERPKDRPFSVDLLRFYETRYPIEQKLYVMFLEHRMRTFQGAFHMNPDYMHWYGWAEMKRDLVEIKSEAKKLREEFKKKHKKMMKK